MRHLRTALAAAVFLTGFTACGNSLANDPVAETSTAAAAQEVTITVHAAASLQTSFEEIAAEFTAEHPRVTIDLNFAGSSTLLQNLTAGSPGDVFASADELTMDKAQNAELIAPGSSNLFAANKLVGIVPTDNPANISTLEDANADGVNLVVCAPQVPCGALSQTLADAAGITLNPVSEEQQVSDVLGKVRSGQADAGLVYATDAALAPDEVTVFELESAEAARNFYAIARTSNTENPDAADAFIEFVHSAAGQEILVLHGFQTPGPR